MRYAATVRRLVLTWHGRLPDSDRERDLIRSNRACSILLRDRAAHLVTATQALQVPTCRHADRSLLDGPWRTPTDQTSTPESRANGPNRNQQYRIETPLHPAC